MAIPQELTNQIRDLHSQGMSAPEIARKLDELPRKIYYVLQRLGRPRKGKKPANAITPEELDKMQTMRAEGYGNKCIAYALGRAVSTVHKAIGKEPNKPTLFIERIPATRDIGCLVCGDTMTVATDSAATCPHCSTLFSAVMLRTTRFSKSERVRDN